MHIPLTDCQAIVDEGHAAGWLARWGAGPQGGGGVGDVACAPDARLDLSSFEPYPPSKQLWVGVPGNSAVGRQLAAACGPKLTAVTSTTAASLHLHPRSEVQHPCLPIYPPACGIACVTASCFTRRDLTMHANGCTRMGRIVCLAGWVARHHNSLCKCSCRL